MHHNLEYGDYLCARCETGSGSIDSGKHVVTRVLVALECMVPKAIVAESKEEMTIIKTVVKKAILRRGGCPLPAYLWPQLCYKAPSGEV